MASIFLNTCGVLNPLVIGFYIYSSIVIKSNKYIGKRKCEVRGRIALNTNSFRSISEYVLKIRRDGYGYGAC